MHQAVLLKPLCNYTGCILCGYACSQTTMSVCQSVHHSDNSQSRMLHMHRSVASLTNCGPFGAVSHCHFKQHLTAFAEPGTARCNALHEAFVCNWLCFKLLLCCNTCYRLMSPPCGQRPWRLLTQRQRRAASPSYLPLMQTWCLYHVCSAAACDARCWRCACGTAILLLTTSCLWRRGVDIQAVGRCRTKHTGR